MAKRHQFVMFLHYAQDKLLDHKKKHTLLWKSRGSIGVSEVSYSAVIRKSVCLNDADLITKGYAVGLNGQRYSTGGSIIIRV